MRHLRTRAHATGTSVRRRSAAAMIALGLVVVPAGTAAGSANGDDWAQADHDASGNRANPSATQITRANVDQVGWLRGLAAPPPVEAECGLGFTVPVIAGKRAYAVSTGRLIAYDLTTGAQLWQRVVETGHLIHVIRVYAVSGGRVFVGSVDCISGSDPGGSVRAFDATTGAPLWSRGINALSEVTVTGGLVVGTGSSLGSGTTLEVLDAATGALVWDHVDFEACGASAVVSYDRVYFHDCQSGTPTMVAASVATGAEAWRKPGLWSVQRSDSVGTAAKHLYTGSSTALNPANGATRFTLPGSTRIDAVDATRVYANCGAVVCAFTRATGARLWTSDVPASGRGFWPARLAVAGGLLYSPVGTVMDAATGEPVAQLWDGEARELSVGNGYVVAAVDGRTLDVYGLPGT